MTTLLEKRDQKLNRLNYLKRKWDQGDKSPELYDELNSLLTQVESIEALGSRSLGARTLPGDGPLIRSTTGPFETLGEQIRSVVRAGTPGQEIDSRLYQTRDATGLAESTPSSGGFAIQQDFSNELLREVFDTGLLASRCRRIPITVGNSIKIPGLDETSRVDGSRQGGIRVYWKDEASVATASKPTFRLVEMNLHKMIGLCYLTEELMEDAPAMEEYVRQAFIDEFAFQVDKAIFEGLGSGQPLGIMNSGAMISIAGSGGAGTVTYTDVIGMWSRLIGSARSDAVWLINQSVEPQLFSMSLAVGSGGSAVYLPPGGASATPYGILLGRPVLPFEHCQALGTSGDIVLGAFKKGYLLAEKGSIQTDVSISVRFLYDEQVLRFRLRLDGQPLLSSAVTPLHGNATLSHFVKLDTRS